MGCYVDPENQSKEDFLKEHGEFIRNPNWNSDTFPNKLLVCLLDNGPFTAAGVAYKEQEFHEFNDPRDYRPKTWFLVDREKLKEVSPIENWLK